MMKKINIFLLIIVSILTLFSINTSVIASSSYYASISNSLTGEELKLELRDLITSTHTKITSYTDCKTSSTVEKTDGDPNNSGNIILFWSGLSIESTWDNGTSWNREHVWPQSKGWFSTSNAGSDLHHIRPTDPTVNGTHSSLPYGEIDGKYASTSSTNGSVKTECEYNSSYFEPGDNRKGDVARIIFYLVTRYQESDVYFDGDTSNKEITDVVQSVDMLLRWNELDPVDDLEKNRNEEVYTIQGNRNPFIDNSNYVNLIWGDGTLSGGSESGGTGSDDNQTENDNQTGNENTSSNSNTYRLVKDITELEINSEIIIAANSYDYALSTTQNSNNRGQTAINKNSELLESNEEVQKLSLVNGTVSGTFGLFTGSGYLSSASSSSNYLHTTSTLNDNSSWKIEISSNGIASIIAQGTYSRNILKYNSGSSIFACYGANNTQKDVGIYILDYDKYSEIEAQKTKTSLLVNYCYTKEGYENKYSYQFTSKAFNSSDQQVNLNGINWTLVNDGNYYGYDATKGQQIGSGNNPAKSCTFTSDELNDVKSIVINVSGASSTNAKLTITVGGVQIGSSISLTSTATTYTFNSEEPLNGVVQISYSQTSSKALYIKSIDIECSTIKETYNITSAAIRFGTCITKEMYDLFGGSESVWGVEYYKGEVSDWTSISAKSIVCTPARVAYSGSNVIDENGEYYQFALVVNGMTLDNIDTYISARVYVIVDGVTYYMLPTTYSLREVANSYLTMSDVTSFQEHLGVLEYLKNYSE